MHDDDMSTFMHFTSVAARCSLCQVAQVSVFRGNKNGGGIRTRALSDFREIGMKSKSIHKFPALYF
jgi:hypothetical protein